MLFVISKALIIPATTMGRKKDNTGNIIAAKVYNSNKVIDKYLFSSTYSNPTHVKAKHRDIIAGPVISMKKSKHILKPINSP